MSLLGPPSGDASDPLDDLDPSLADPPADAAPVDLAEAREQLSPAIADLLDAAAPQIVGLLSLAALTLLLVELIRRKLTSPADAPTPGPSSVAAALGCALLYLFGRVIDPLLASLLDRPPWFPVDPWTRVGWFEWKLLGYEWSWGALPLADHPTLGLVVHVIVWLVVWLAIRFVLDILWTHDQRWSKPEQSLAFYQRWVGSSTTRRADQQFRRWLGPVLWIALPIHALAGLRLATLSIGSPAPGTWVIGGLILWMTAFHLLVTGKPPAPKQAGEAAADELEIEAVQLRAPIDRLRQAVEQLRPGVDLEALELRPASPGTRAEFPPTIAPLVREIFIDLTGQTKLWAHQAELLGFLGELWRMQPGRERGEIPSLSEERGPARAQAADISTPHALVLAPEGSGRTTITLLAALHVFFDRGATSLVLVRDRATARQWNRRLERALLGSSARWNVLVCLAGENLASALIAERTPAIVIADLETCEAEVLGDPRTDSFLARLGLVVADDVDSFTGVAEMHLQLCMRRLWALLDRLHEAAYPAALLATCGNGASGMDAWAKHVLAQPMRLFSNDQAAKHEQLLLRRRDLVDGGGQDVPLALIAQACDEAGLAWHLRLAGDAQRHVRRAAFDLGKFRRHFCEDPREAAIVIVEGTYGDVRREADRLAHAGLGLAPEVARSGAVVLVLAPPGDEEMVLHEEAEDAPKRELIASLPRAVALAEPRVVRQRHFDRALGREQDLSALRDRFGAPFVDETVAKLGHALRSREILQLDPQTNEIVARTLLAAVREGPLGQPIDAACVSDRGSRASLVDAGTSELLQTIDEAVVRAIHPPGRIFLHPRGRFMIAEPTHEGDPRSLAAEPIDGALRTSLDRSLALELPDAPIWSTREFGGRAIAVTLIAGTAVERVHGVRRFGPGPKLLDHRVFEQPIEVRYGTDLCLIATGTDPRGKHAIVEQEPAWELLIPLCAAIRMMLPAYLRAGEDAVDVDVVEHEGHRLIAIFDRTLGGSGCARFVCERGLADLLSLARMVLERLVGPEFARLRHIHDRAPHSDPARWQIGDALRWLDDVLDRPPLGEAVPGAMSPEALGPRVEFVAGEGHGDLGRLWISQTGRTDDLVWTRHSWISAVPLAGLPAGTVSFDVAVERPAIAAARRRALLSGGISRVGRESVENFPSRPGRIENFELLEADASDLEPIRACLRKLCGDSYVDAVLGLVAAIPIRGRPLAPSDRGPLAVLARRRADRDAKLLLACALLPDEAAVEIVRGGEGQGWISFVRASGRETWALEGPTPRRIEDPRA